MTFLTQYGLFLLKIATLVAATLVVIGGTLALIGKQRQPRPTWKLKKLNTHYQKHSTDLQKQTLTKQDYKNWLKTVKKHRKTQTKPVPRVFVLQFMGDMQASNVSELREEITAIINSARAEDEVVVCLESSGGTIHGYGLATSQLQRLRDHKVTLTVIIDKIAASGGYMMACVAHNIIAAPFAIIGSVGVVSQLPNFNRWLKKHAIDYEQLTAGEFKRTLTLFGENTSAGREKMQQELESAHRLFKTLIQQHRPQVDLDKIATGEYWFGTDAMALNLIDTLQTSDDYLLTASQTRDVFKLSYHRKKSLTRRLGQNLHQLMHSWRNGF